MGYEVYPRVGLGPFRLGMTQEEAEKLRNRLGLPKPPDSFYLEYEEGCLSRIGLNTSENIGYLQLSGAGTGAVAGGTLSP